VDQVLAFVEENYLYLMGILLVAFILVRIVKSVIKWLLLTLIVFGVAVWGYVYVPEEIREVPKEVAETLVQEQVDKVLASIVTATNLDVSLRDDGSYILSARIYSEGVDILLTGKPGSDKATLYIGKVSKEVKLNSQLIKFIQSKL